MILFKTVSVFRKHLAELLKVRRNVYAGVSYELNREFAGKPIDQIRQNNDMILIEGDFQRRAIAAIGYRRCRYQKTYS